MSAGDVDYALVRLRCRLAARPSLDAWTQIRRLRATDAVWAALRQSGAAGWLQGLNAELSPPALEAGLLRNWRAHLLQIAAWLPPDWHPLLSRCADGAQQPWLPLRWLADLQQQLPKLDADARAESDRLVRALRTHIQSFSSAAAGNGWPLRESLQAMLEHANASQPLSAVTLLRGLLLLALDYERLRGELLRRACALEQAA